MFTSLLPAMMNRYDWIFFTNGSNKLHLFCPALWCKEGCLQKYGYVCCCALFVRPCEKKKKVLLISQHLFVDEDHKQKFLRVERKKFECQKNICIILLVFKLNIFKAKMKKIRVRKSRGAKLQKCQKFYFSAF